MLYGDIFWEIITLFLLTREMYQIKTCHNFFFLNIHFRENLYMREQGTLFFLVGRKLFPSFNDNKEDILVGRMLRCQTSWPHLLSCPHFGTNKGMANVWPSCRIPAHIKSYWELVGFWMGTIPHATVMHVKREHGQLCDLIDSGFIREEQHPDWAVNIVPVTKKNGKIWICIDFRDKWSLSQRRIPSPNHGYHDWQYVGFERMSFMDRFSGYNQIKMYPDDEKHTSFRTPLGVYCYTVIPFGLKNAGATCNGPR